MAPKSKQAVAQEARDAAITDAITREMQAERVAHKKAISAKNRTIGNLRADKKALLHKISGLEGEVRRLEGELKLAGGAPLIPQINVNNERSYVTEIIEPLPLENKED